MDRHRLRQVQALLRLRELAGQRAELDTSEASVALERAGARLQQANSRMDEATRWKIQHSPQGRVLLGMYEQALLSEQKLGAEVDLAESCRQACESDHQASCVRLLEASRALKVAHRRRERAKASISQQSERRCSDDAADLWLSRRPHVDR